MGAVKKAAALAAAAVAGLMLAAPAHGALRFERCGSYGYQCARMSVPLDHSGAVAGRISLFVKRVRARGRATRPPLFVLAGGPGQSATAAFDGDALALVYAGYRDRDLIVFDQRGTGRSGVLRCRALERSNLLRAGRAAGSCARRLGARRGFYTSRDSVEDIDQVRRTLGARRIALFGTSYGTKVALGYALGHPAEVDRLVLDSVVEAGGPNPFYLDTLAAVPRALRALCRGTLRRVHLGSGGRSRAAGEPNGHGAPCGDGSWTRVAGHEQAPSTAAICSRYSWRATSIRRCGPPSRAPCAPRSPATARPCCGCAGGPSRWTGWHRRRGC